MGAPGLVRFCTARGRDKHSLTRVMQSANRKPPGRDAEASCSTSLTARQEAPALCRKAGQTSHRDSLDNAFPCLVRRGQSPSHSQGMRPVDAIRPSAAEGKNRVSSYNSYGDCVWQGVYFGDSSRGECADRKIGPSIGAQFAPRRRNTTYAQHGVAFLPPLLPSRAIYS